MHLADVRREYWCLGGLSLFFITCSAVWLRLDHSPPTWDDGFYLTNSLIMFDSLIDGGLLGYARGFLTCAAFKPPLISVLPTPAYLVLGRHAQAAYSVNLFFMLVMFVVVFRLGERYACPRAGLIAAYVAGTTPMLYGLSRWFLVEYTMAAMVAVAVLCLVRAELFWFSVICGLGMLLKVSFPLYVTAPFLHWAITSWPPDSRLRTCLALAPAVLLPLPWYAMNYRRAFTTAIEAGAPSLPYYGNTSAGSYFLRLVQEGPSLYYATLVALLIVVAAFKRELFAGKGLVSACIWMSPFVFFVFGPFREPRYTAPLLPAFALAAGLLLDPACAALGRWRNAGTCALLAFPMIVMLQNSFGIFGNWSMGSMRYTLKYDKRVWPQVEILQHLDGAGRLLLASDTPHFNVNNFALAALERRSPLEVTTSAYEEKLDLLLRQLDSAAFVIYKDGGNERGSWFFNKHADALVRELHENRDFIELPFRPSLPDGGVVHIFKSPSPNSFVRNGAFVEGGFHNLTDCSVTFDDQLQLTGFAVQQFAGSLEVKYRWRCRRPPDREYWCFTHVVDEQDRIVGYLDHQILGGSPLMVTWREGDVAMERLRLRSSAFQEMMKCRLVIGLFHRASGSRLPVKETNLPLTDNGTAVYVQNP